MAVYATVQLVLKDMEALGKYREVAVEALEKHGGKVIGGGPNSDVLEDTGAGDCIMVLLEFPDTENARGWIDDPDLQHIHDLRKAGASTRIMLMADLTV